MASFFLASLMSVVKVQNIFNSFGAQGPGNLEPRDLGAMGPWSLGTYGPRDFRAQGPKSLGTQESRNLAAQDPAREPRSQGTQEPRTQEPRKLISKGPYSLGTQDGSQEPGSLVSLGVRLLYVLHSVPSSLTLNPATPSLKMTLRKECMCHFVECHSAECQGGIPQSHSEPQFV